MNKLILVRANDRKKASAFLDAAGIENVIVLGGIEVDWDDVDEASKVLEEKGYQHLIEEALR